MSSDVVIGYHGKPRCAWAGAGDTAFGRYHDEVWGTRTDDESAMFEALTLGVFEVGLSWSIVFGKRDAFRSAFRGFDVIEVAAMTEHDVDRLVADASIIRNRGKIQATVDNARAMMSASPNLVALAKSYEITRERAPRSVADLPTSTPQAQAFAKQLNGGTASSGPRACTRSCRTSAWSTTTSTGASAPSTTAPPPGAGESPSLLVVGSWLSSRWESRWDLADLEEVEAEGFELGEDAMKGGGVGEQTGEHRSVPWR